MASKRVASVALYIAMVIGLSLAVYGGQSGVGRAAAYIDAENRRWRIPTNGFVTKAVNKIIQAVPRISGLRQMDSDFDLDNKDYINSTVFYVMTCGLIGIVFALLVGLYFLLKYKFNKCGGKALRRDARYRQEAIQGIRIIIMVFSFGLAGMLIYGIFSNVDLDASLRVLVSRFYKSGMEAVERARELKGNFSDLSPTGLVRWDESKSAFIDDLDFSIRFFQGQMDLMKGTMDTFEGLRMFLVIFTLIISTVSCAIGIAAGNVSKGLFVIIMMIMNAGAGLLIFFSLGLHFAGSKSVWEFCDEIGYYLDPSNPDMIPMRLQFFTPCMTSPAFFYIADHYMLQAKAEIDGVWADALVEIAQSTHEDIVGAGWEFATPYWFNFSDPHYDNKLLPPLSPDLRRKWAAARSVVSKAQAIDDILYCKSAKRELAREHFLFCTFMKDNLDMLTMSQALAGLFMIIITINGAPGILMFEWAGRLALGGVLGGQRPLREREARAKRDVK